MKTVLVTGSSGFIGRNLVERLEQEPVETLTFTRDNTSQELGELVMKADFVFHLAAVLRPADESEFDSVNTGLTNEVFRLVEKAERAAPILLTSSIQAELDNAYGLSKRANELAAFEFSKRTNIKTYTYRLPNIFGKWARPNYSSVVATFCHNISHGLPISIHNPETTMTLAYIDDVVDEFVKSMLGQNTPEENGFYTIPRTFTITLQELADTLKAFSDNKLPDPDNTFESFLYTTYTAYADEV